MCQADETTTIADAASPTRNRRQSTALYDAGCDLGEMIDLLDTITDVAAADWVDPRATLRRIANLCRVARCHASRTLETVLAAEGAEA